MRQLASTAAFIGRTRELAELRSGLEDVLAGRGRFFLIAGEPGIGKTRLAEQVAEWARESGALVSWGRCREGGGAPAYWPWIQIFRSCLSDSGHRLVGLLDDSEPLRIAILVPEIFESLGSTTRLPKGASGDPEQERFRFFDSAAQLLKRLSSTGPLVIIVDDLQAADEPSLQMLVFVARELKGNRLLLVGTYRNNEIRSSPTVSRIFANLVREGTQLPLRGFSRSEIEEYLDRRAAFQFERNLVDSLSQVTGGNPLFLDGIIRMLQAEAQEGHHGAITAADFTIPHGVCEAIRTRLNSLSCDANRALRIASVVGKEFEFECVRRVDGRPHANLLSSIDEIAQDGIIIPVDTGHLTFRFSHDLIRQTIYKDLLTTDRLKLHQQIAEAIEEIYRSNLTPHLADLAYHYGLAAALGNSNKAIEYLIKAGDTALVTFAYEHTTQYWTKAIELLEHRPGTEKQRAQLYSRLGWMTGAIERPRRIRYLEEALKLYAALNEPYESARIHVTLGMFFSSPWIPTTTNIPGALAHYRETEILLQQEPRQDLKSRVSGELELGRAVTASRTLATREGLRASRSAVEMARGLGDHKLLTYSSLFYSLHLGHAGRLAEACQSIERVWQAADKIDDITLAVDATTVGGGIQAGLCDPGQSQRWYECELSQPRTANSGHPRQLLTRRLGEVVLWRDKHAQTFLPQMSDDPAGWSSGFVSFWQGHWEQAVDSWTYTYEHSRRAGGRDQAYGYVRFLAWADRLLGRHMQTEVLLKEALAICSDEPLELVEMWARPEFVLLCIDTGRVDQAAAHLERCREIIAGGENWKGLRGKVALSEAVVAAASWNLERTQVEFEKAIEIFRFYDVPYEEAETLYYWGRAAESVGDHLRAAGKFKAAAEVYRRCGAGQRWIERALAAKPSLSATLAHPPRPADLQSTFRKQGDSWIISFAGTTSQLRDSKGFYYLACLLRSPSTEIAAIDLTNYQAANIGNTATASLSDFAENGIDVRADLDGAAPALDSRARAQYRQRLADLKEELETAERNNDSGRKERLLSEIDALMKELKTRFGRGKDLASASHPVRPFPSGSDSLSIRSGKPIPLWENI